MIKLKKILNEEGNFQSWHIQGKDSHVDPPTNPGKKSGNVLHQKDIDEKHKSANKSYGPYTVIDDYYFSTKDVQDLKTVIKEHRNLDFYDKYRAYMVIHKNKKYVVASVPENSNFQDVVENPGLGEYFIKDELGWRIPENEEYALIGRHLGNIL